MKKIKYPPIGSIDFNNLVTDYTGLFSANLSDMEDDWLDWKKAQGVELQFPETVSELLVADAAKIADIYVRFTTLGIPPKDPANPNKRNPVLTTLDDIFHYSRKYDSKIAAFFENRASVLGITSCHYCDLSYINVYTLKSSGSGQIRRHFDLDHLGSTDISVKMKHKDVKTQFYLEDEISFQLVQSNIHILEEKLNNLGYNCKVDVINDSNEVNFVEDFLMKDSKTGGSIQRYSFDVRA